MQFFYSMFLLAVISITATGCAIKQPAYSYQADKSRALNIVEAANMTNVLKDATLSSNDYSALENNTAQEIGYVASSFAATPVAGLTSMQFGAISLANVLLSAPNRSAEYGKFIGFVPKSFVSGEEDGEEAVRKKLLSMVTKIAETEIQNMGFKTTVTPDWGSRIAMIKMDNEEIGCNERVQCYLTLVFWGWIGIAETPDFLRSEIQDNEVYWLTGGGEGSFKYQIERMGDETLQGYKGFSEIELMRRISRKLPEWLYVYVAPDSLEGKNGKKLPMPLVLEQGKVLQFAKSGN